MTIHESGEMYLETILILSQKLDHVRSIDVVEHMGFSKPSVSRGMKILREQKLIDVDGRGAGDRREDLRAPHVPVHVYRKAGRRPAGRGGGRLQNGARDQRRDLRGAQAPHRKRGKEGVIWAL